MSAHLRRTGRRISFRMMSISQYHIPLIPNEAPFEHSSQYPASRIRFVHLPAGMGESVGRLYREGYSRCGSTGS